MSPTELLGEEIQARKLEFTRQFETRDPGLETGHEWSWPQARAAGWLVRSAAAANRYCSAELERVVSFNVGDRIEMPGDALRVVLEIVEVRSTGYTWRYVPKDGGAPSGLTYRSETSGDPMFVTGWVLVSVGATRSLP